MTIEHIQPFLSGTELYYASLACRYLYEAVSEDERLREIMSESIFHSALEQLKEFQERGDWCIDPADFASVISRLLPQGLRVEQSAVRVVHASFETIVFEILTTAGCVTSTAADRPDPIPSPEDFTSDECYSVRVTRADLDMGLRLSLWGGGPFLDKGPIADEELVRFRELDKGSIRLARRSGIVEFEPCLFPFVGALLRRYVQWVVGPRDGGAVQGEEGPRPTPCCRVNQVLGLLRREVGSGFSGLRVAGNAPPVEQQHILPPEAFGEILKLIPQPGRVYANRILPPRECLGLLHAALDREVEQLLAFCAAAIGHVSEASYASHRQFVASGCYTFTYMLDGYPKPYQRPKPIEDYLDLVLRRSPWCNGTHRWRDMEDLGPWEEGLRLAIAAVGVPQWLEGRARELVGRFVGTYLYSMLWDWEIIFWELVHWTYSRDGGPFDGHGGRPVGELPFMLSLARALALDPLHFRTGGCPHCRGNCAGEEGGDERQQDQEEEDDDDDDDDSSWVDSEAHDSESDEEDEGYSGSSDSDESSEVDSEESGAEDTALEVRSEW
jgi:hypothetical protein